MVFILTKDQQQAIDHIEQWYRKKDKPTYFLSGYAGTGKTSTIQPILDRLNIRPGRVRLACYTGIASLILDKKLTGGLRATTIHKTIYNTRVDKHKRVSFELVSKDHLRGVELIIIDEASMVSKKIYADLLSFDIPILFIGDIGQLPPVDTKRASQYNVILDDPDYTLTEIHRQAEGSPIIELATMARHRETINFGIYGKNNEIQVISKKNFESDEKWRDTAYLTADQIICGYNKTRRTINDRVRLLRGFNGTYPKKGDKLIALRNNWNVSIGGDPLVNGFIGVASSATEEYHKHIALDIAPWSEPGKTQRIKITKASFDPNAVKVDPYRTKLNVFDYGYAITCHKAQGGEWDNVLLINQVLDPDLHHKWLYTAITRIAKRGVIVV